MIVALSLSFFFFFLYSVVYVFFFFFFQAEDGIRDHCVTGVQTCALPIFLIFLGSQLSNKVSTDLYQRHRDTESWTWKKSGRPVKYRFETVQTGSDESRVALLLCLSGSGPREMLPAQIDPAYFVYELTLDGTMPSPTFLSLREDLENFRIAYQDALAGIAKVHGSLKELELPRRSCASCCLVWP